MQEYLTQILLEGVIRSQKDYRIFWLMHDHVEDTQEYDIDYTPDSIPSMSIDLLEGTATILVERIPEAELTLDDFSPYRCAKDTPILFNDYDGIYYDSYEKLQDAYINKQLEYYRTQLEDCEMSIGALDDLCRNNCDWKSGKNYTHFLDEGRILVETFSFGNGFKNICADIEPLSGYEVVEKNAEYFKDFPVRVNFLYPEQVY